MDTSLKNWALLIGSTIVAGMLALGYTQPLVNALALAGDVVLWLVRPLGPQG